MSRYLLSLLLLLPACTNPPEQTRAYLLARATASAQPAFPFISPGLRLGMDSGHVARQVDSLRGRNELNWYLRADQLPMQVEPHYEAGRLIIMRLLLNANGQPGSFPHLEQELHRGLRIAYSGEGFPHDEDRVSWFKGGTEIELRPWPEVGYFEVTYIDLHHVPVLSPDLVNTQAKLTETMRRMR